MKTATRARVRIALVVGLASALAVALADQVAAAKTAYESRYGFDRTWNSAIRLVRVDLGLKVLEKDDANGFLLFEYKSPESGSKPSNGSFEFIRSNAGGAARGTDDVKVVVQLPQMPRYHEQVLLDSLVHKMHDDYGDPPAKRDPAPPPPPPDAGAEGGDGTSS